ncbi:MAG: hypothetical protein IT431_12825 [Phycisphaerales bacterium]|nr:hypothetical protein [Phycisphaerales bacterium]
MTRSASHLWTAAALASALLAVALGAGRLRAADARADAAAAILTQVRVDAGRVLHLRARDQTVAPAAQPQQDVFRRVNETLAAAGLPQVAVRSVTPAGDRALEHPGAPPRRAQSVRIALGPITPAELGAFLERWHAEQPLWTITAIDLTAPRQGAYQAAISASAVYLADAPPAAPAPRQGTTP